MGLSRRSSRLSIGFVSRPLAGAGAGTGAGIYSGILAGILVGITAASCAAPTLPLPPPTALVEGPPDASGNVTVRGNARRGSFVACLNENREVGVLGRADPSSGDYTLVIGADIGDDLRLWQFDSPGAGGMAVFVTVPDR